MCEGEGMMEPKEADEKPTKRRKVEDVWEGFRKELEKKGKQLNSLIEDNRKQLDDIQKLFEQERNQMNEMFGRIKTSMDHESTALQKERQTWEEMADKLKQTQLPNRIKLDVGGKTFATSSTTLTSIKGTFFDSMFGGEYNRYAQLSSSRYRVIVLPAHPHARSCTLRSKQIADTAFLVLLRFCAIRSLASEAGG